MVLTLAEATKSLTPIMARHYICTQLSQALKF
jgi:hypothetical protein